MIDLDNAVRNPNEYFYYSSLYKGIKTILLETNESCLIGAIDKMRVFDNYIFIMDCFIAKSLYVFDKEGRFIRKIGNNGQGPGEYVQLSDFTIDKENKIVYVLDSHLSQINKYDITTGKFIHTVKLDQSVESRNIEYVGGKLYADAYFRENSNNQYLLRTIQEPSGKEEHQYLNVVEYNKGICNTYAKQNNVFQPRENGNVVLIQWFMDHIIEITKDSVFPLIDIKSKNVLTSKDIKKAIEKDAYFFMSEITQLNKYHYIHNYIEQKNWILYNCFEGHTPLRIMLDKQTSEVRIFERTRDDLLVREKDYAYIFPPVACYDTYGVYYHVVPMFMSEFQAAAKEGALSPNLDKLEDLKNLEEDANPVILYYEFKD